MLIIAGVFAKIEPAFPRSVRKQDNTKLENIAFYQKCGFRMFEIRRDYFAYIQPPIAEHGIVLRDMLVLRYGRE
jgi:ribosomal protein S18 acetylase RimI-like enzyme